MPAPKTATLLIDRPARKGLNDVNILNADQHQDTELALFFMCVEFSTDTPDFDEATFRAALSLSSSSST
jgi:formyltetrahydrofolate deformylase